MLMGVGCCRGHLHGLLADGAVLLAPLQAVGVHVGEVVLQVVGGTAVVGIGPAAPAVTPFNASSLCNDGPAL